jgi:uncharacterized protein (DUF2141 family)
MKLPRRPSAAALLPASLAASAAAYSLAFAAPVGAESAPAPNPPPGCAGPASNIWINVVADGLRNSNGLLAVTVYADDSKRFLAKKGSLYVARVDARSGTTRACVFLPKPGVYALALYHDENSSQRIDRSGLGLPTEGFGFSNNPATLAGLPTFRSVRLNIPKSGLTTRVQMKYP